MALFSPASEVIQRHQDELINTKVLFAGDLQDDLPCHFDAQQVSVHCSQYHHWQNMNRVLGERARFGLLPESDLVSQCDTLIYYWPKSKAEAQFQLSALLSKINRGTEVFIVGENRSGVRSAESMLAEFGGINKIDSARRCSLYHFHPESRLAFDLDEWWGGYQLGDIRIKTLPGVFSWQHLDMGSELLLSCLTQPLVGSVLDIGCGSGVLTAVLAQNSPQASFTLADTHAAALAASEATLQENSVQGRVVASDVFSNIEGRFNTIISNPPFHEGRNTSYAATEELIQQAKRYLLPNGELYIVANAFLPYPDLLDQTFGQHQVLAQTNKFKVYKAVLGRHR